MLSNHWKETVSCDFWQKSQIEFDALWRRSLSIKRPDFSGLRKDLGQDASAAAAKPSAAGEKIQESTLKRAISLWKIVSGNTESRFFSRLRRAISGTSISCLQLWFEFKISYAVHFVVLCKRISAETQRMRLCRNGRNSNGPSDITVTCYNGSNSLLILSIRPISACIRQTELI